MSQKVNVVKYEVIVDESRLTREDMEFLIKLCPVGKFKLVNDKIYVDPNIDCLNCKACVINMPENAVKIKVKKC